MTRSVAVVVPVHGAAPYLRETIEALAGQTRPPDRVVVVDDGCDAHALDGVDAEVVRNDGSRGAAAARNAGVAAVDADLVAFCDGDDRWSPGKLEAQLRAWDDAVTVSFGRAVVVGREGAPTGETWAAVEGGTHGGRDLLPELYASNPILLSSVLLPRSVLVEAGGFDTALSHAEDWELWLRLACEGATFQSVPEATVLYRRHELGLTADVRALAAGQLSVHRRFAQHVDPEVARAAQRTDLLALADGAIAERRWAEARAAFGEAAALGGLPRRSRLRRVAASVPFVRGLMGRAQPYSGGGRRISA